MSAALVAAIVAAGRAAWPAIVVEPAAIAAHLARLESAPAAGHHAELYLACACALGDRAALAALDRGFLAEVPTQIRTIDRTADFGDEVRQRVRARLLVAEPGALPRIAAYGGRGPLGGWIRTAAIRIALDEQRRRRASAPPPSPLELLVVARDPELAFLKRQHQQTFRAALEEAIGGLATADRQVLRLHLCAGLSAVRIGTVLGLHHATVSRRLLAISAQLFADTRRLLTRRLKLTPRELDSLVRLVQSQLEVSVARVLAETAEPTR